MKFAAILLLIGLIGGTRANRINVPCTFTNTPRGYTCRLPDVNLADVDFDITGGNHLPGQNDGHVVSFVSINNNFRIFPNLARFVNLRHLQVTGGLITRINVGDFSNRPQLQSINLSNNQIFSFDENAFANLTELQDINLRFNRIRNLIPDVFNTATNTRILDLSYNMIERIASGTLFSTIPLMSTLLMSGNQIDFINQTIFDGLSNLNFFDISSNICYSDVFFGINVPSTRQQMLQRLQPCFADSPVNLRCQFSFINMNDINGYGCTLTDIQLYNPNQRVTVDGFHISPNTNNNVRFLRVQVSYTPFIIQELFEVFPNLEGFEVIFSYLTTIDANSFANARNLRYINIRNNPIQRLEANIFQHATNLLDVQFWHNSQLQFVSENAFTNLTNLRDLQIISSKISYIQPLTFRPLISLVHLNLNQNRINYVDSRWFSTNRQLSQLKMDDNAVEALHPSLLDLPRLETLALQRNQCVNNVFFINIATRNNVRNSLRPCFDYYPFRQRRFVLDVKGDITFFNSGNNNEVIL